MELAKVAPIGALYDVFAVTTDATTGGTTGATTGTTVPITTTQGKTLTTKECLSIDIHVCP